LFSFFETRQGKEPKKEKAKREGTNNKHLLRGIEVARQGGYGGYLAVIG